MKNNLTPLKEELEILLSAREFWHEEGAVNMVKDLDEEIKEVRKLIGVEAKNEQLHDADAFALSVERLKERFNTK